MIDDTLTEMSDAHHTEAMAAGWDDIDSDSPAIQAALAMGKARAFETAASLVAQSEAASQQTLDSLGVATREDFINHHETTFETFQLDSKYRKMMEESPLVQKVNVVDDQTISVMMATHIPEEI